MKQLIRSGKFTDQYENFVFSSGELDELMVDAHEFLFEGKMYDIVSIQHDGAMVKVCCIRDDREKKLISEFGKYLSGNQTSNSSSPTGNNTASLLKFLQGAFLTSCPQNEFYRLEIPLIFIYQLCIYQSPSSSRLYPPPKALLYSHNLPAVKFL
jgi:hypothetical protein